MALTHGIPTLGRPRHARVGPRFAFAALVSLAAAGPAGAQHRYVLRDLGALPNPGGVERGEASGINTDGQVVGFSNVPGVTSHGFVWQGGVFTDVGTLPGGGSSNLTAINGAGTAVGGGSRPDITNRAVVWTQATGLRELGGLADGRFSFANAVAENGVVVGSGNNAADVRKGFRYDPATGAFAELATLGGAASSQGFANGVNDRGQIVGQTQTASGAFHATYWDGAAVVDVAERAAAQGLGNDLARASVLRGVNDAGVAVGQLGFSAASSRAVLYDRAADRVVDLGALGAGQFSFAYDVNNLGQVVGYSFVNATVSNAFLWQGGALSNLNDLADTSGWQYLQEAKAVNDAGAIVGYGRRVVDASGTVRVHAFLLTPVPEPGTVLLVGAGLAVAAVAGARRRRG